MNKHRCRCWVLYLELPLAYPYLLGTILAFYHRKIHPSFRLVSPHARRLHYQYSIPLTHRSKNPLLYHYTLLHHFLPSIRHHHHRITPPPFLHAVALLFLRAVALPFLHAVPPLCLRAVPLPFPHITSLLYHHESRPVPQLQIMVCYQSVSALQ